MASRWKNVGKNASVAFKKGLRTETLEGVLNLYGTAMHDKPSALLAVSECLQVAA
jgi:hypothetical protein